MRLRLAIVLVTVIATFAAAQTTPQREIREGKLVSGNDPPVVLEFGKAFRYAGGQVIDIFKVAGAEQHFFVDAAADGAIRRFYWVQFEQYYPSNRHTYDYTGIKQQPLQLGALTFLADTSVEPDYFTSGNRAGSDSEAGEKFLHAKGYKLDGTFVRLRLFHLPDASRRKELMIIYGEALPPGASGDQAASVAIQHARENLQVAQNRPDMSGVWQLNKERSKVDIEMAWAKVELTGSTFSVNMRTTHEGKDELFDWQFTLGSAESSNTMHGAPMKSHAGWEGDALAVRSVTMFGSDALKTVDWWTLSDGGNTLTLEEKHQYASEPEGTSRFVFERRAVSAWPAAQPGKVAEEVYKNIQVMKGLPSERLPVVMGLFTRWLGVKCVNCHVDGDFVSDAKPAKQTARKMWSMVGAINRDSFGGSGPVTCWTCHRGSVKPESLPQEH